MAAVTPKLVRFSLDGKMLTSYEIPDDLGLKYGLTGIYAGDQGEILLEREGGVYTSQLVDANGTVNIVTINRYPHKAKLYSAHPANLLDADATRGYILIDQQMVDVTVNHDLGGLRILGFAPDDSFYVIVDEMQITPVIQVDQKVYHYSSTGEPLGMARMPLVEQYTYVPHGLTVGPDGSVFALITRSDHAEVWRLTFTIGLDPIIPSTLPTDLETRRAQSTCKTTQTRAFVAQ